MTGAPDPRPDDPHRAPDADPASGASDGYHALRRLDGLPGAPDAPDVVAFTKPGARGFPGPADGAAFLLARLARLGSPLAGLRVADATASAGQVAIALATRAERPERLHVAEPSRAGWYCLDAAFGAAVDDAPDRAPTRLLYGEAWRLPPGEADAALLIPTTDRGTERVRAELRGAAAALRPGGTLWCAMHRDRGAKRYEKEAIRLLGAGAVVAKDGPWRLLRAERTSPAPDPDPGWPAFRIDDAPGGPLDLVARPGVHAAGKLDPGTARLLPRVPWDALAGRDVLDLGCGYGVLALLAARAGAARAVALDDAAAAVESAEENARRLGLRVDARASDVASALERGARFDVALVNPPFHVGERVTLEVPHAFVDEGMARLRPGGTMWLVANRALAYEGRLARWGSVDTVEEAAGFKVLRATRAP